MVLATDADGLAAGTKNKIAVSIGAFPLSRREAEFCSQLREL
jgi:hypothetical protein